MIFPAKCFHSLHAVANDALAPLAFRGPKPDMARLAIRVSLVHRETDIVVLKFAIAFEGDATCALSILAIDARSQKWVAAFGAEEMVFVVCTFAKLRVVQSDKSLIHNGRLTMVAPRREALVTPPLRLAISGRQQNKGHNAPRGNRGGSKVCHRARTSSHIQEGYYNQNIGSSLGAIGHPLH